MYNDIDNLKLVLKAINDNNLQDNMILIGSWCELFYQDLIKDYISNMKTRDHDFLIKRPVNKGEFFHKTMTDLGFLYFDNNGKSKYQKEDNEVEFLTTLSRNYEHLYKVPNIKLTAECLPYFEIVLKNLINVELDGYTINIPTPAAYVLHKLLINPTRKEEKQEKDIDSVSRLIIKMIDENIYINEFINLFNSLPKKQKNTVISVIDNNNIVPLKQLFNLSSNTLDNAAILNDIDDMIKGKYNPNKTNNDEGYKK